MALFLVIAALITLVAALVMAAPLRGQSRRPAIIMGLAVPVLTVGLYMMVGTPAGLDPGQRKAPATIEEAVALLETDLERDPRQPEGWRLLGRAYAELGRADDSRDAFQRAARLDPENLDAQVEHAGAIAAADPQHRFNDEATAILEQVLRIDPAHQRARLFLGIALRQAGQNARAAETWEPLLAELGPDAAAGLFEQVNEARADAGMEPLAELPQAAEAKASPNAVTVRVSFDPDFASMVRLDPDAVVFVVARLPDGSPMPVAARRLLVRELPLELTLTDADAVMPTQALSAVQEVELVARISSDGTATAQPDDVTSPPVRITLPADGAVDLVLGGIR